MNVAVENIPAPSASFNMQLSQSRISPIFLALISSISAPVSHVSNPWLSVTTSYYSQAHTTFVEFLVDYTLPPTVDVVPGVDFLEKCRSDMPALAAMYTDEGPDDRQFVGTRCNGSSLSSTVSSPGFGTALSPSFPSSLSWSGNAALPISTPSSVSRGGPDVVSTRSPTSGDAVGAVVSSEAVPARVHDIQLKHDNKTNSCVDDSPVALSPEQKTTITHILVLNHRMKAATLRGCAHVTKMWLQELQEGETRAQ
ncbi:hypothetical protein V5O48_016087 [Marasmius crinis-equi]|uniref:Uncharacterized protein n=1 Tax=Marasmius crinis-equi TaxID=585013 RepID=A0ABR3ESR4_9AGAR